MKDENSLAHTKWKCEYHIVFTPKQRSQVIYGRVKMEIGQMLRKLCEEAKIVEAEGCSDHMCMLVRIPRSTAYRKLRGIFRGRAA